MPDGLIELLLHEQEPIQRFIRVDITLVARGPTHQAFLSGPPPLPPHIVSLMIKYGNVLLIHQLIHGK